MSAVVGRTKDRSRRHIGARRRATLPRPPRRSAHIKSAIDRTGGSGRTCEACRSDNGWALRDSNPRPPPRKSDQFSRLNTNESERHGFRTPSSFPCLLVPLRSRESFRYGFRYAVGGSATRRVARLSVGSLDYRSQLFERERQHGNF